MKQKRYWLRIGLLLSFLAIIFMSALVFSQCLHDKIGESCVFLSAMAGFEFGLGIPVVVATIMENIFKSVVSNDGLYKLLLFSIIISTGIVYFCIGSFIGWLYGKWKSRVNN